MTVLLVGAEFKEIELLRDAIADRGADVHFASVTDWPGETPLTYVPGEDVVLGSSVAFDDLQGAYVHVHALFHPHNAVSRDEFDTTAPTSALNGLREHRSVFESLCRELESRGIDVLPKVRNHYLQEHKPWQLSRFEAEGLPVPETIITNDPQEVEAFYESHERAVYKPVAKGAPPSELTEEGVSDERLDALAAAPVQFQKFVEGEDLRVYVLDGEVVGAIRYRSDQFSFKLDQVDGNQVDAVPATLSEAVRRTSIRAADVTDLTFGAVDVRRRSDGGHAILEVNEAPSFAAADLEADQDVTGAVADYLTGSSDA